MNVSTASKESEAERVEGVNERKKARGEAKRSKHSKKTVMKPRRKSTKDIEQSKKGGKRSRSKDARGRVQIYNVVPQLSKGDEPPLVGRDVA